MNIRWLFFLMAGFGLGGFGVGQLLEIYGGFIGCRLCHVERGLLLLGGIHGWIAVAWWPFLSGRIAAHVMGWIWRLTSLLCFYHAGIQYHLFPLPSFCRVQEAESLEKFLVLQTVPCDQRTLDIFGIPMALLLAISLGFCSEVTFFFLRKKHDTPLPHA